MIINQGVSFLRQFLFSSKCLPTSFLGYCDSFVLSLSGAESREIQGPVATVLIL